MSNGRSARTPAASSTTGTRGTTAPSDLALRVSALADGAGAVDEALAFHDVLLDAIDAATA